jgi:anti-sigma regulatory factor (Ser/Thr protein kinase)
MISVDLNDMQTSLSKVQQCTKTLEEREAYVVRFVADEILSNLKRHGDFSDKSADITLEIKRDDALMMIFKDNSKKFNILEHNDPDISADIDDRALGGLGIFLTKKYAKRIEYRYENGYNILEIGL